MFFRTASDPINNNRVVNNNRLYQTLGVSKDASPSDIKKAYRALAIKNHPDKGGEVEEFKKITQAYEILSDPEKKSMYDQRGEDMFEQGNAQNSGIDLMDILFGGKQSGTVNQQGENIKSSITVTLENVYNGHLKKIAVSRTRICRTCSGLGAAESDIRICEVCKGKGIERVTQRIGPMIQQFTRNCHKCDGKGKIIKEGSQCKACSGSGTCKDRKILDVYIEKGIPNEHKITFGGEANQTPSDKIPGDVIFTIKIEEHEVFKRNENQLTVQKSILLSEALLGVSFVLRHLDQRELLIESSPGEIINPDEQKAVREEGMPMFKKPFLKGHLFIKFNIIFPLDNSLSPEQKSHIKQAFTLADPPNKSNISETHCLVNMDLASALNNDKTNDYSSDEEEDQGRTPVTCTNQ